MAIFAIFLSLIAILISIAVFIMIIMSGGTGTPALLALIYTLNFTSILPVLYFLWIKCIFVNEKKVKVFGIVYSIIFIFANICVLGVCSIFVQYLNHLDLNYISSLFLGVQTLMFVYFRAKLNNAVHYYKKTRRIQIQIF